jgi:hypothetical protein
MKSGWVLTAVDNTIAHMAIYKTFLKENKCDDKVLGIFYGDDNL